MSARQIAAAQRRAHQAHRHAHNSARVEAFEAELEASLSTWRGVLHVAAPESHRHPVARPFVNPEPGPTLPSWEAAQRDHTRDVCRAHEKAHPLLRWYGGDRAWAFVVAVCLSGFFGSFRTAGVVASLVLAAWACLQIHRLVKLKPTWLADAKERWPAEQARRIADHERAAEAFRIREDSARRAWDAAEQKRVAHAEDLLAGRSHAIAEAVTTALESMDVADGLFALLVDDEDHVLIDVDLPEIEDIVPEIRHVVRKDGSLAETKRKTAERNAAYAEHVCGLALAVAAAALSAAPTLRFVTVAGRTERTRAQTQRREDVYLYEAKIARSAFHDLNAAKIDPVHFLCHVGARIQRMANEGLKEVPAPTWVQNLPVPQRRRQEEATEISVPLVQVQPSRPIEPPGAWLALTTLAGIAVFSLGIWGGEEPKMNASANITQPAPPSASAPPPAPSPEEQRIRTLRLRAIELTEGVQAYDGTKASTQRTVRAVIATSKRAKADCELAGYVSEALEARGHLAAAKRYDAGFRNRVCAVPRAGRVPRKESLSP